MITINQEKTLSKNKKAFLIISLLQVLTTILPFAIVLLSIKSREWGQWHGVVTTEVVIFNYLIYSPAYVLFFIFLIFTIFNPTYKNSAVIVLISLIITYIFSTGAYGPRLSISLLIIKFISVQLWMFISVMLIGILLIFIFGAYMEVFEPQDKEISE